jgi:prepilin-type N-terminal cleavage/methylation domain-containing protein
MAAKNNKKGFTLIELLVVIAIIGLLSSVILASLNSARSKGRDAKRVADLHQIQLALELYYDNNNAYPIASPWRSQCAGFGSPPTTADKVIPGLVPTYMSSFPVDPLMGSGPAATSYCYVYGSSGTDYILLDHDTQETNYAHFPSLIDPARDSGKDPCVVDGSGIWALKVSSPGARCW